jgi:hypothetical protein
VRLNEFLRDTQEMGRGIVVGQGDWQQQLEKNKNDYTFEFVQGPRFLDAYPLTLTHEQYVDKVNENAGGVLTSSERSELIGLFNFLTETQARASVLRHVAENEALKRNELNRAFVLMECYGYMRRNPDDPPDTNFRGWKFWLDKLNEFNGNYVSAEMVKAFISSDEYRHRFGL